MQGMRISFSQKSALVVSMPLDIFKLFPFLLLLLFQFLNFIAHPVLVGIWESVNTECVPLDMDIDWKYIMLVPAVIDLMFTLYSKI
jgi:hypothetical protein